VLARAQEIVERVAVNLEVILAEPFAERGLGDAEQFRLKPGGGLRVLDPERVGPLATRNRFRTAEVLIVAHGGVGAEPLQLDVDLIPKFQGGQELAGVPGRGFLSPPELTDQLLDLR